MWPPAEITAGTERLTANKLTTSDQETLHGVFLLYLKSLAGDNEFTDLTNRLAVAEDVSGGKTASKLVATLILLEEKGFDLTELKGGRSGLQTNEVGKLILRIRLALTLLGYVLPEEFSGSVETGDENISGSNGLFFPSITVRRRPSW